MKRLIAPRVSVVAALVAMACLLAGNAPDVFGRQSGATKPKQFHTVLRDVPVKDRVRVNPMARQADSESAGGKLFELHCAECHGKKAGGTRRAPSLLRQEVQDAPPGAIFWVLTNGVVRRGMPVWSKLPEPQRWQIVTFLKSFKASKNSSDGAR